MCHLFHAHALNFRFGYPSWVPVLDDIASSHAQQSPQCWSPADQTHNKTLPSPRWVTELFFNLALCVWSKCAPSASMMGMICNTFCYFLWVQRMAHATEQHPNKLSSTVISLSQLEMRLIMAVKGNGEEHNYFCPSLLQGSPKAPAVQAAEVHPMPAINHVWAKALT